MNPPNYRRALVIASYCGTALGCAGLAYLLQWPPALTGFLCATLAMLPPALRLSRERAEAGRRQEQTQSFVQRLLDVIPEPVYIKDEQGRYVFVNEAFAQRRHQDAQSIIGRTAAELAPDADTIKLVSDEDARVLAGASIFKEDRVRNPLTGTVNYRIVTKGSCLDAEGKRVIIGANFDITSMRTAEQQLQIALAHQTEVAENTRAFIQHILDVIPYPMYVKDANSVYLIVNKAFIRERGAPCEQILGFSPLDLAPETPQARRSIEEDRRVLAGHALQKEEGGQHPLTGELYFQLVIKGSCPDIDGKPVIVGVNIDITDLRTSEQKLQNALDRLSEHHQHTLDFVQRILDLLPYPVYVKDAQSRYLMVNEAMARDHFMRRDQLINHMGITESASPETMRRLFEEDGEVLAGKQILREEHAQHQYTGRETFRILSKGTCANALGEPVIVGAIIELTDLRLAERELKSAFEREVKLRERTQEFIQRLIDVIPDPVYVKKAGGLYLMVNTAFAEYHQMSKEALVGAESPLMLAGPQTRDISLQEDTAVLGGQDLTKEEHTTRKATGEEVFRIVSKRRSIYFDGVPVVIGIDRHITRWRVAERELQRLAQEDMLTGISNRRHFHTEATHAVARAKRYGEALTLLMLDIDHFKTINDTWGHQTGDEVLIETVQRIRASLRGTDIPARWGGEEFIVLLPHTAMREALFVAERLRSHLAELPVTTKTSPVPVTVSIGIAEWARNEPLDHLVSRADAALYRAKSEGRNRVIVAPE